MAVVGDNGGATDTEGAIPMNPDVTMARCRCRDIADFDDANIGNINSVAVGFTDATVDVLDEVPLCPPISAQALISPEFQPYNRRMGCFQSIETYTPENFDVQRNYEFASVCCYNNIG